MGALDRRACLALLLGVYPFVLSQDQADLQRKLSQRACSGTLGNWCTNFDKLPFESFKAPPSGDKLCPANCNGVGNCNHDTGLCECPAGWEGADCRTVLKRPCTIRFRNPGEGVVGHIDEEGRDLDPRAEGFTESRCIGICDDVLGRCFCDGAFRPIKAPKGSPPGTPWVYRGRPLGNHLCQPNDDGKGFPLPWGQTPWVNLYGPKGWCNAIAPEFHCGCMYEGFAGPLCDKVTDHTCPNQCTGHGDCDQGFCKCHDGWYGTDCARQRTSSRAWEPQPVRRADAPEYLEKVLLPPPAAEAASGPVAVERRRPYIYVYDLPAAYNARMLQYRVERSVCVWRSFIDYNQTDLSGWTYSIETLLHEMMLQSPHRTFDPEEADFFYMPIYSSCFIFPIHCWADGPWWHSPSGPRVMHVTNMMIEARDWVQRTFPYWDRRGGRDHIWLMTHDEGACYAPSDIYRSSIFLTHWGRTDMDHKSNTAFTPDNYTQEWKDDHPTNKEGWLHLISGHPCFTPGKDLVIPAFKPPRHFDKSPLLGAPARERTNLLYFRGDVGKSRLEHYSRGIRQKIYGLSVRLGWRDKHKILVGDGSDLPGGYSDALASSRFCLVAPGDGWSPRAEDAILHGCIPVVVMDEVEAVWESILDFKSFSVRIPEADVERLPHILEAIPDNVVQQMQRALRRVWYRYAYTAHPLLRDQADRVAEENLRWRESDRGEGEDEWMLHKDPEQKAGPSYRFPHEHDAFHTIIRWLSSKIKDTR